MAIRRKQLQKFKRDRGGEYKDQDGRNASWISQAEERAENQKRRDMFNIRGDQQSWPISKRRQGGVGNKKQGSPSGSPEEAFWWHFGLARGEQFWCSAPAPAEPGQSIGANSAYDNT
ncbi:hypothetical protein [Bradyrhizobium sp. Ec3.3]|uniref:hypothetical protein n=1 Tax=Bradyrhizobium sp. Ec3.3 TaxID=189753 RepID=UPI001FD9F226|nr:hypothetical protein [Bradyrhizobium sp. Ec3.3]